MFHFVCTKQKKGTVWRVSKGSLDSLDSVDINSSSELLKNATSTVIKVTNKYLHEKEIGIINDTIYHVQEDILKEAKILNILTSSDNCPKSIVKYHNFFQRYILSACIFEN